MMSWEMTEIMNYIRDPTKPEPGVMATRPAMAPEQNPTALHFLSRR
jgi:hypothetical protein